MARIKLDQASSDELGIFIDAEGSFRILVPNTWVNIPEFAYLAVAATLRLSQPDEIEFMRSVAAWAEDNLRRKNGDEVDFIPAKKRPN